MANKLELTWVGKENEIKVEPRILIENPALSNMSHKTAGQASLFDAENADGFDNMLIHGDNLLALKALESKFAGKIKCIYIDPPYNTGNAFDHYDDNLEHSIWLNLMRPRLEILKNLLHKSGMIFIQIDDNEYAYLKVLCDEIFGRSNYLNTIAIKAKAGAGASGGGEDKRLKKNYEFILIYVKDYDNVVYNPPIETIKLMDFIRDHKENNIGFYYTRIITNYGKRVLLGEVKLGNGELMKVYEHKDFEFSSVAKISKEKGLSEEQVYSQYFNDIFMVTNAQTSLLARVNEFVPEKNRLISYEYVPTTGKMKGKIETKLVWNKTLVVWLRDSAYLYNDHVYKTQKTGTLWDSISWGRLDLEGGVSFKSGKKPESLLKRIFEMSTIKGDLILDSFLGSGTTAAVAQKMGRRWIGIEMGDHAYTHCKVRLDKVIDGSDQGGVTKSTNWKGGGGYKFYELAPTLVVTDKFGNPVINKEYNADMLAAAMALQEGFTYCPDDTFYWKQGKNENAYIFTTTSHVTADYLASIHSEMQDDEYLVIACKTYDSGIEKLFKNITVKKIPQVLLGRCEFGKNDYSLNIIDMPSMEEEDE